MECGPFGSVCCGESSKEVQGKVVQPLVPSSSPHVGQLQADNSDPSVEHVTRKEVDPNGWNDPEKSADSLRSGMVQNISGKAPVLKRGLSNFSMTSSASKKSGKSSTSGGSGASNTSNGALSRWSKLLDVKGLVQNITDSLKDDERMVSFGEDTLVGVTMPASINERSGGKPNRIRTTKFTWLTWLPKSLAYQFMRVANIYFLFIALLVIWPWSPKNWKSKIFPFIMVLMWTALKDLYEDMRRRRDDDVENAQRCYRLKHGKSSEEPDFEEVKWADVVCGDIVYVKEDEAFPTDLLLVHPAGDTEAFISTVMLDGETSLKNRQAPSIFQVISKKCQKEAPDEWQASQTVQMDNSETLPWDKLKVQMLRFTLGMRRPGMEIKFAGPTPVLADVRGTVQPRGNTEEALVCPFTDLNFLPRGCVLRNTPWVLGLAIYVGDDTKTRLNATNSTLKFSNMQVNLNNCVRGLLVVLFAICGYATIMAFAGEGSIAADLDDLPSTSRNPAVRFFMFCITFYHVVPMSLYVMYEMLKLVLAYQVNTDKQMYDPVRDQMAQARTAEVMEEMGQVNFLFSDKTGTLTANEMVFARCHVGGQDLGEFRKSNDAPGAGMIKARELLENGKGAEPAEPLFDSVLNFWTCLAVCHSVQVTYKVSETSPEQTEPSFSGMSPDEVALVQAAHEAGVTFRRRVRKKGGNSSELILQGPGPAERKFTVLHELAFSSDRKRMSVIARHKGGVWCITKGADSVMEGLLTAPFTKECSEDLSVFSKQGLRTLIVGMRLIETEEFDEWNKEFIAARNTIDDTKDEKVAEVSARIEKGLKFIGVTAVEDRLQEGVPDTIRLVKDMGIRLWVLTGDKTETAVDIARSCLLFSESTVMAYAVLAQDAKDAEDKLLKAHSKLDGQSDTGLVLDGQTLLHALKGPECRKIIYELGVVSRSCICARLSPMQKLELVKLVREQNKQAITLAIGDGANDVPMITGAHLGIAIRGKEGTQAVQASDIAISYFRFLLPLLMCHGRRAYRRVAIFLNFYLYKNVLLLMSDIVWMHQDKFRAQIAFPEYLSIGFNVVYSAWHILFVIGFDNDISDEIACSKPQLYAVGPRRGLFNARVFTKWIVTAVIQGTMAWLIPFIFIGTTDYDKTEPGDFWVFSTVAFSAINIIVNLKLVIYAQNPLGKVTWLPTAGAFACYGFALFMIGYTPIGRSFQPCMWHIPGEVAKSTDAMIALVVASVAALAIDVVEKIASKFMCPSELQIAQRER